MFQNFLPYWSGYFVGEPVRVSKIMLGSTTNGIEVTEGDA